MKRGDSIAPLASGKVKTPQVFCLLFAAAGLFAAILCFTPAFAGPPFRSDDPIVTEYRHWEFYLATTYAKSDPGAVGTLPTLEVDYGLVPGVQLHLLAPSAYVRTRGGPTVTGPGNIEVGANIRLVKEGPYRPLISTLPLLEVPTASKSRGLGTGKPQLFLPLWISKSLGPWTAYGGGGYSINPGPGNRNFWYTGWVLERELSKRLTIGAEAFRLTPSTVDSESETGYDLGGSINFSEKHHFIWSVGRDIKGPSSFFFYAGYLMTWGPGGETEKSADVR